MLRFAPEPSEKTSQRQSPSRFSIQITFNLPLLKMKKCTSQSARALIGLLLCGVACFAVTGTLLALFRPERATNVSQRTLTFAERVAYQHAIEDVYWRHRIWPKERPDPKPSLDAVMSQAELEKKVTDYLRKSQALEDYWQRPITAEQLQAEMDRMAKHTNQSEVLHELFAALGNDPFVIGECLARPLLTGHLVTDLSTQGKTSRFRSARTENPRSVSMDTTTGNVAYTPPTISEEDLPCAWTATNSTNAPTGRAAHSTVWTGSEMIVWGGHDGSNYFNTGGRYDPSTDSWTASSGTNAPAARGSHTAVWTGSEMIVWGGFNGSNDLNTGSRYNPAANSWAATSIANTPSVLRDSHSAVWTGSEMIVWGGYSLTSGTVCKYRRQI